MRWMLWPVLALLLVGCVSRPEPAPATMTTEPPPWGAPRDAVSHIRAANLPELPLDSQSDPFILSIEVTIDDQPVPLAPFIGIDRLRALQAPVHTHEANGDVWLEGEGNREVTLGQFFTLWGVRFDGRCVGNACVDLEVTADGTSVEDPVDLVLRGHDVVAVRARS